jgi:hypothetical protein
MEEAFKKRLKGFLRQSSLQTNLPATSYLPFEFTFKAGFTYLS